MKFLFGAGVSAIVAYIFVTISLFTQAWVTASISQFGISVKQSAGIFPWSCVSENSCNLFWDYADGWAIIFFLVTLLVWIIQFFATVIVVSSLFLAKRRVHLSRAFLGLQAMITVLLFFVLIGYGATYQRNTDWLKIAGVSVTLGYSYWLLLVTTIFSIAAIGLGITGIKKSEQYDYR